MSKPKIQIPEYFALNGEKADFNNEKIENGYDRLTPDVLPGDCLNKFIDDTYKGLNGVLELYQGAVIYDEEEIYNNKSIIFNIDENNEIKIYRSLVNNNQGNTLENDSYWQEVKFHKPYLKTSYVNGASGYNIWSNGYCEQWGYSFSPATESITFVKKFKDTNFIVITQPTGKIRTSGQAATYQANFNYRVNGFSSIANVVIDGYVWIAKGYLAEGEY